MGESAPNLNESANFFIKITINFVNTITNGISKPPVLAQL
jgi:hypothetical protein